MAAQEKKAEEAGSVGNSKNALPQGRLKLSPKCPRTPVLLHELDSKMASDGLSPAYTLALMSHTKVATSSIIGSLENCQSEAVKFLGIPRAVH